MKIKGPPLRCPACGVAMGIQSTNAYIATYPDSNYDYLSVQCDNPQCRAMIRSFLSTATLADRRELQMVCVTLFFDQPSPRLVHYYNELHQLPDGQV